MQFVLGKYSNNPDSPGYKPDIPKPNPKLAMRFLISSVKPIVCPHCGYEIAMDGYSNALSVELIEDKKSTLMCPSCFAPICVGNEKCEEE